MKNGLVALIVILFGCAGVKAQQTSAFRRLLSEPINERIKFIKDDSVKLSYNENFNLVEEGCGVIIRNAHINRYQRIFYGRVTDVSRLNPNIILTDGYYTFEGIKEGIFITRYLNGNLKTKGNFKDDRYEGRWETYYENGKPELAFEADSAKVRIINAWDETGIKRVDNGKGNYQINLGEVVWKGKLLNGMPDGTWKAILVDDVTNRILAMEQYKNGVFIKGKRDDVEYKSPNLTILKPDMLPFISAERMEMAEYACETSHVKQKHIVNAQYINGMSSFSQRIAALISDAWIYSVSYNLKTYYEELIIGGEIDTHGFIGKLKAQNNIFNIDIVNKVISRLQYLPALQPASVDGIPVVQKFTITFLFRDGRSNFSYRFLPLQN
jgi:antitoxin component YwqK of YwqJK toxin-antitoxin module